MIRPENTDLPDSPTLNGQPRKWLSPGVITAFIISGVVLPSVLGFSIIMGAQFGDLSRNMALTAECPPYYGAMDTLGGLLWCTTTVLAAFSALIASRSGQPKRWVKFLICTAALTGLMTIDDLYLLHEIGWPTLFGAGPEGEKYVLFAYMALAGTYLLTFRRELWSGDRLLLVCAAVGMATSIVIDLSPLYRWRQVFEDSPKFFGIACWVCFHATMAVRTLNVAFRNIQNSALAAAANRDGNAVAEVESAQA